MARRIESDSESGDHDVTLKANRKRTHAKRNASSSDDEDNQPLAKRTKSEKKSSADAESNSTLTAPPVTSNKRKLKWQSDSSDDDVPLAASSPNKPSVTPHESDDEDDKPLANGRGTNGAGKPPSSRSNKPRPSYKEDSDSDDAPLARKPAKPRKSAIKAESEEDSDDDAPLAAKSKSKAKAKVSSKKSQSMKPSAKKSKPPPKKKVKKEESDEGEDEVDYEDDEAPSSFVKKLPQPRIKSDTPASEKPSKSAAKAKSKQPVKDESVSPKKDKAKRDKAKKEEEKAEEEDIHRWWEAQQLQEGDTSQKWTTLEHNGILFPPPYVPLPKNVRMKYDGQEIKLSPEAEEVAGFFAALLETDHAADDKFKANFFKDWLTVLKDNPSPGSDKIKEFDRCDFRPMYLHFEAEKAAKKSLSAADKKKLKAERDELEAPYRECVLDGRKEKVGNFRIEPPSLFRGRGDHPRKGALKFRVTPEDIILNIGKNSPIPVPNAPGNWGKVVHDQTVTWLANWKENVNGNFKYVFLAAGSSIKGQSDMNKFEKARELKSHVDRIRQDYTADLKSKITADRQRATAMYFIDKLALRAGNEKGEDEADTVGCCSLRYEHVTLEPPNKLIFDFLGKDSIRYFNTVDVDPQVFKNIRIFKGDGKTERDPIFDRVTTAGLNKHLQSYMKGLTAKVFRTYNASITFQEQLDKLTPEEATDAQKLAAYTEANRLVAILCNHQKSVSKGHGSSMEKMTQKLGGLKYQRMKYRHILFNLDPKMKKKRKDLAEDESDLDEDFIEEWEEELKKRDIEKAKKKFEKENEKLVAEGKSAQKPKVLEEALEAVEEEYEELKKERDGKDVSTKHFKDTEKVLAAIEKMDEKIKTFKLNMDVKEKGKDVSLGTSKINYLDPRITAAWCKKHDIPVTKLFSKTLMTKFPWAMDVDDDWTF